MKRKAIFFMLCGCLLFTGCQKKAKTPPVKTLEDVRAENESDNPENEAPETEDNEIEETEKPKEPYSWADEDGFNLDDLDTSKFDASMQKSLNLSIKYSSKLHTIETLDLKEPLTIDQLKGLKLVYKIHEDSDVNEYKIDDVLKKKVQPDDHLWVSLSAADDTGTIQDSVYRFEFYNTTESEKTVQECFEGNTWTIDADTEDMEELLIADYSKESGFASTVSGGKYLIEALGQPSQMLLYLEDRDDSGFEDKYYLIYEYENYTYRFLFEKSVYFDEGEFSDASHELAQINVYPNSYWNTLKEVMMESDPIVK